MIFFLFWLFQLFLHLFFLIFIFFKASYLATASVEGKASMALIASWEKTLYITYTQLAKLFLYRKLIRGYHNISLWVHVPWLKLVANIICMMAYSTVCPLIYTWYVPPTSPNYKGPLVTRQIRGSLGDTKNRKSFGDKVLKVRVFQWKAIKSEGYVGRNFGGSKIRDTFPKFWVCRWKI